VVPLTGDASDRKHTSRHPGRRTLHRAGGTRGRHRLYFAASRTSPRFSGRCRCPFRPSPGIPMPSVSSPPGSGRPDVAGSRRRGASGRARRVGP
jgi:hypothetical protein